VFVAEHVSSSNVNMYKELDLGCGRNKHPGALGLDMNPGVNPDVLFEFNDRKILPFANDTFDKVWAIDFIEHIQDIKWLLSEVHRVAKPDAKFEVRYPHYSDKSAYGDVTHVNHLGVYCLDHFDPSTKCGKQFTYYTNFGRNFPYKIEDVRLQFSHPIVRQVSSLMNKIVGNRLYESYIAGFLPISNVEQSLRVVKEASRKS
jgi:SAM-dependent methyltransferase